MCSPCFSLPSANSRVQRSILRLGVLQPGKGIKRNRLKGVVAPGLLKSWSFLLYHQLANGWRMGTRSCCIYFYLALFRSPRVAIGACYEWEVLRDEGSYASLVGHHCTHCFQSAYILFPVYRIFVDFSSVVFLASLPISSQIPDKDVGMCIGRSGCVIKEMQNKTGSRIQIPSQAVPGQGYRIATVSGQLDACNQVKQMIDTIIMEQSSQNVMTGANFTNNYSQGGQYGQQGGGYGQQYGAYGQQQGGAYGQGRQQQAGGGQKDYSAEWAAYYAQQAQQQGGGAASAPAPAPAPGATAPAPGGASAPAADGQTPAANAYYDAFYRYAVYYGEEAARQYYGAWSPPPGRPNPYASGGAGAPAPAAGSPPSGQQQLGAPAPPPSDVVDSSARAGVSNLPAWMTNQNKGSK